jgi:hypothetical protein
MGITPIVTAALVGGGASIAGGLIGAAGAKSAARTQQQTAQEQMAAQQAAGQQAMQINTDAMNRTNALYAPYVQEGVTGMGRLNELLPYLSTPYDPTMAQLEQTPGYQFTLEQGLKSVQNANAAKGLGISGAALKGAAQYATGLAQNTYAQNARIYQQNQQQIGNLLTTMGANGQNALNAQTQADLGYTGNTSNALTGQTNQAAQTAMSGATAGASGTMGATNAITSGLANAANIYNQNAMLQAILAQNGKSGGSGNAYMPTGRF